MPKTKNELQRLLTLIPFLNTHQGQPVEAVAGELGVTTGELAGDLDRLSLYGSYPYGPDDLFMALVDDQGRLEISAAEQFRAPLHLTPGEAVALRLSLLPFTGIGRYHHIIGGILHKLEGALLPQDLLALGSLEGRLIVDSPDEPQGSALAALEDARFKRLQAEIVYYSGSSGQMKSRVIDPYGFVLYAGQWYAAAYCHSAGEIRTFKAGRIKDIRILETGYEMPADFDIGAYARSGILAGPRGTERAVKIWFSKTIARWILERSANAKRNRDGSAVLTIRTDSFAWVARWILQYGPEARILEPKEAVQEMEKIIDAADKAWGGPPAATENRKKPGRPPGPAAKP